MPAGRRWIPSLIVGAALGCALPAAPAPAASPRCDHLRGRDLVAGAPIKVVSRTVSTSRFAGRVLYGCEMPAGRIFRLGSKGTFRSAGENLTYDTVVLRRHAGRYLLVDSSSSDASGAGQENYTEKVWDLRSGRKRTVWHETTAEGGECLQPFVLGNPSATVLGANGIFAGVYKPSPCTQSTVTRVLASLPGTSLRVIDRGAKNGIPAVSLKLSGRTLTWVNGGAQKTAEL